MPGLIDCHVHLVADGEVGSLEQAGTMPEDELDAVITRTLSQEAAAGVTTVRDLGDTRFHTLAFRDRLIPGIPRIVASGPPLTSQAVTATSWVEWSVTWTLLGSWSPNITSVAST